METASAADAEGRDIASTDRIIIPGLASGHAVFHWGCRASSCFFLKFRPRSSLAG